FALPQSAHNCLRDPMTFLSARNFGWCPSIAWMAANAALTRIWPIAESNTLFLSSGPPWRKVCFQHDREGVVRSRRSEAEIHHREAGLRRREFPVAPRPERRGRSGLSRHFRAVTACRFDAFPLRVISDCRRPTRSASGQPYVVAFSSTLSRDTTRFLGYEIDVMEAPTKFDYLRRRVIN